MTAPKLFISYSWSSPEHEQWVITLATELRESGVDVVLDKWDLKEGHDAIAFMEQMVRDPDIKKVILIFDKVYAEKADGRAGGVGTETQIISPQVYAALDQNKFVAVVTDRDNSGKPHLPIYYKSRIYIDLVETETYAGNFEQLLRWIFDKPLHVKPPIGSRPSFLTDTEHATLGTTALFRQCFDALRHQKASAVGLFDEYCNTFTENVERFRIGAVNGEYDDAIVQGIEAFIPYRNEAIQLIVSVARYSPTPEYATLLHRWFEAMLPYLHPPRNVTSWREGDFDNFRFVLHELFLYAIAILLKYDWFSGVDHILSTPYYLPANYDYGGRDIILGFEAINQYTQAIERRKQRLRINLYSLRANLIRDRCAGVGIEFRHLAQADFTLFLRSALKSKDGFGRWSPVTLVFSTFRQTDSPFEIWARAVSKRYFDRVKVVLGIDSPKDLEPLFEHYEKGTAQAPSWGHEAIYPPGLIGYRQLATLP